MGGATWGGSGIIGGGTIGGKPDCIINGGGKVGGAGGKGIFVRWLVSDNPFSFLNCSSNWSIMSVALKKEKERERESGEWDKNQTYLILTLTVQEVVKTLFFLSQGYLLLYHHHLLPHCYNQNYQVTPKRKYTEIYKDIQRYFEVHTDIL